MGEKEEEFSSEIKTMAVHFTRLDSPSPRKTSKNSGNSPSNSSVHEWIREIDFYPQPVEYLMIGVNG
jgi:hypothetical protein